MNEHHQELERIFSDSLVIGGSPCSGKSTIAARLAADFDLPYYKVDDHLWRHLGQADPVTHPTMSAYAKMSWDEIWSQPVESQVLDVFAYYTEQFPMILDDLSAYRDQGVIIMEGAAFLPELIFSWRVRSNQAIFLVPSRAFQINYYSQRDWVQPILAACVDSNQAFSNWMERDHRFGSKLSQQALSLQYPVINVDGNVGIDEIYATVRAHFQLSRLI